jgi:hypothetical protein
VKKDEPKKEEKKAEDKPKDKKPKKDAKPVRNVNPRMSGPVTAVLCVCWHVLQGAALRCVALRCVARAMRWVERASGRRDAAASKRER